MLNDSLSLYTQVNSIIIITTSITIFSVSFIIIMVSTITTQQLSYAHLYGNRTEECIAITF